MCGGEGKLRKASDLQAGGISLAGPGEGACSLGVVHDLKAGAPDLGEHPAGAVVGVGEAGEGLQGLLAAEHAEVPVALPQLLQQRLHRPRPLP